MKKITIFLIFLVSLVSCQQRAFLKNLTHSGGYAMGERVELRFAANKSANPPDSIAVYVIEKNTKYRYTLWAKLAEKDDVCGYEVVWDGRKDDGSWPAGGGYLVYASIGTEMPVFSDTVTFGLGD